MSRVFEAWQRATLAAREAAAESHEPDALNPPAPEMRAEDLPPALNSLPPATASMAPMPLAPAGNHLRANDPSQRRRLPNREHRTFSELIRDIAQDEQELG